MYGYAMVSLGGFGRVRGCHLPSTTPLVIHARWDGTKDQKSTVGVGGAGAAFPLPAAGWGGAVTAEGGRGPGWGEGGG